MTAGIPYDSHEGRAICGAISAIMTGISYATSAEMAKALGPFPGFEKNRDHMLRVMRNHRRAAYGAAVGYEGVKTAPVPLDDAELPRQGADHPCAHRLGQGGDAGRSAWLSQCAGNRHRADRHDRPGHGLRHHRHRARFRAGQVQEARRRRLFQDHQPGGAGSAAHARLWRGRRSRPSSPMRSAMARSPTARRSTMQALKTKGFGDAEIAKVEAGLASAFDIKFVFNKFTLGEAFCRTVLKLSDAQLNDIGFDLLTPSRLQQGRDRSRQYPCLRRHDARRRARASRTSICRSSTAPIRAAGSASAICRSRAISA